MTITDIIVILFLLLQVINGTYQGFLRSLIGPAALLTSMALSWSYYIHWHNFILTCLISIIGPFLISWLIKAVLQLWISPGNSQEPTLISRLLGQTVCLAWGGALAAVTVALLCVFPFNKFELDNIGKDVHRSYTATLIKPILVSKGILPADRPPSECQGDACKLRENNEKTLAADARVQDIMNDPRIQKLINDPEASAAIQSRDIRRILSNPTIKELSNDPDFVIKAMQLYPDIQKMNNALE